MIEEKASSVIGGLPADHPEVSLALVIAILKAVIAAYECFHHASDRAVAIANHPGIVERVQLLETVNRVTGWGLRRSRPLRDAILAMGKTLTAEEIGTMVAETT